MVAFKWYVIACVLSFVVWGCISKLVLDAWFTPLFLWPGVTTWIIVALLMHEDRGKHRG